MILILDNLDLEHTCSAPERKHSCYSKRCKAALVWQSRPDFQLQAQPGFFFYCLWQKELLPIFYLFKSQLLTEESLALPHFEMAQVLAFKFCSRHSLRNNPAIRNPCASVEPKTPMNILARKLFEHRTKNTQSLQLNPFLDSITLQIQGNYFLNISIPFKIQEKQKPIPHLHVCVFLQKAWTLLSYLLTGTTHVE